ncbi:M56 family metallopeptidase [Algoriphagus machipongonensis]|uniref:Peptidase M56, BlaR1 n=1 Tax=Algoriphagus machipongonensis TaxID=388413 RepID=A3HXP7_9BACT|nr:M56 family metallopeptidase [Algoriphagus machipongonensis]EAZ81370.1 putative peptidase M56, BlaR1 [Algoriphagus machipongonensis]
MTILNDLIPDNFLFALGWTLVHSIWQLILIGGALWLLLKIFSKRSPAFKYTLAMSSLGLTFLVALVTFMYQLDVNAPASLFDKVALDAMILTQTSEASMGTEALIPRVIHWIEIQLPVLVNVWFLGAMLFMFRLVTSLSEIRILRKSSWANEDSSIDQLVKNIGDKIGVSKHVQLRITDLGQSPITFGFLKPVILIPAGLLFQLSSSQLEAILAHELAHIKRNDYLANLFQSSLEVVFFYHPCFWWISQTVKELRENASDDLAVSTGVSAKELAYGLTEVLNFAKQNPPELALAASKKRNPTLQRIKRIMGYPAQTYPQNPIISIPMLFTLLLSAGLMASAQQDVPAKAEKVEPLEQVQVASVVSPKVVKAISDTVNSKTEKIIITDGVPVMVNAENEVIDLKDAEEFHIQIKSDTIIYGKDTVIHKNHEKGVYVIQKNGKTIKLEDMPELELTPVPEFPEGAMAPVMDFEMAMAPEMDFEMAPAPDFEFEMAPVPPMEFKMAPMPPMEFEGMESFWDFGDDWEIMQKDTIGMTKAEKEKWKKEMEERAAEMEKKAAEWEKTMEPKMKEFEEKMKAWEKENEPRMKEYEQKMKEWEKANEPKMKEFEAKMKEWQKAYEPKMKEFEAKMKEWQKSNEPKLKEFEEKMKAWEKEMQPKMEEYQRKMEVWQKENADKIKEFQKKLEEQLNKSDDN